MVPNNPMILLSYVNTKLRDDYPSLEEFCRDQGVPADEVQEKLGAIGFAYDPGLNRFA